MANPKSYYTFTSDEPYSAQVLAIMESIRYHYSVNVLYQSEAYAVSKLKWVMADATSSMQMRADTKSFNWSNAKFPFTAYNIGDVVVDDRVPNYYARSHKYYSSVYNRIMYANPMVLEIILYSFFNTAIDYQRAITLLQNDDSSKTLKEVPITINSILTSFPILIDPEISKGNMAYEQEQQLKVGRIFDLNHTVKVYFHELIIDYSTASRDGGSIIAPVDNIEVALKSLSMYERGIDLVYGSGSSPATPAVTTTDPVDEALHVDVDSNIIINFNISMNKDSVEAGILITPGVNADYVWNTAQTQLVIDKISPFVSGTAYTVSIADNYAKSSDDVYIDGDYDFNFTTE